METDPNAASIPARPDTGATRLTTEELEAMDAYWRAANYLAVGQIYLLANPLLHEPLLPEHVKPRLLGHWGTSPGLSFIYVHLNRVIRNWDLNAIYICGPGHGGPAMVANAYLEGTYSEIYPSIGEDEEGLRRLFRQFSFPGGIPSHVSPETPGSIHEGGELGYALVHAFGAAFDNPDLLVCCVVGDGEAETGPLAASWHSNKFLNPVTDGAVLPVLHLNGYKIAAPTVLARIPRQELRSLLEGYGYAPRFVEGADPPSMHQLMAATLEQVGEEIAEIQRRARTEGKTERPRWPMIVLRTPKGWTGPKEVDGLPAEGSFRSHQVPLADLQHKPQHLAQLEQWMRSYAPEELFDEGGALRAALVEQLLGSVGAHPLLQLRQVLGLVLKIGERDLVRAEGALGRQAVDLLGAGPALGRTQHDHRPARALGLALGACATLNLGDLLADLLERCGHQLVHARWIGTLHESWRVAIALQQRAKLLSRDARKHGRRGDLVAVEVQHRQNGSVGHGVEELVRVPARRQRSRFCLAVADDAAHEQIGVVEGGAERVHERIAELATLVDRAGGLGGDVTGNPAREGELAKQAAQTLLVAADVRVDLAVGPLQIGVCHQSGPSVARARHVQDVPVALSDQAVEMGVDEVQPGRRAPMAEPACLDVLELQWLAQQRVGLQVDLPYREVVGRAPVRVEPVHLLVCEGIGSLGQSDLILRRSGWPATPGFRRNPQAPAWTLRMPRRRRNRSLKLTRSRRPDDVQERARGSGRKAQRPRCADARASSDRPRRQADARARPRRKPAPLSRDHAGDARGRAPGVARAARARASACRRGRS